ncbi:MAG: hypothetical protein EBS06_02660 [Proteobacteria bacterium]|nr:hypothetical protein [Pseudomonadota bacterium]
MFNEKFWLAIAFFTFIALLLKFAKSSITKSLDDKSKAIAEEILAAKELKEKAAKILAAAEKFSQESKSYSKKLMQDAEIEAEEFLKEAEKAVAEEVSKKTAAAIARIKQEEFLVIAEIKNKIISSALKSAEDQALKNLNEKQSEVVLNKATENLSTAIN